MSSNEKDTTFTQTTTVKKKISEILAIDAIVLVLTYIADAPVGFRLQLIRTVN